MTNKMKLTGLMVAFALLYSPMYAEKVSMEKAEKVAQTQLNGMSQLRSQKQVKLRHTHKRAVAKSGCEVPHRKKFPSIMFLEQTTMQALSLFPATM
jgi:hypothetical protein